MMSVRSVAMKLVAVTKDLPIKLSSITKLERDRSKFQHWELDIISYISFIPDVVLYFNGECMLDDEKYSQEWADLQQAGTVLPDDVYMLLLARSMPMGFLDISMNFEVSILADPNHAVTTSNITQAMTAVDMVYWRTEIGPEINRVSVLELTSMYCDMNQDPH
ncbi:hypothetical protein CROQUDRAFT_660990 [Cronartium quercuum f. sp. fusiforme G11]|uniref:Uncharacterized protein n=1 Tax=Cronartium quercuum f. sp. fusiforme G11 TaxID=708437 RepID=A0A9P6NBL8_9BASI|nr:hypothetical protein CROQUDRAFT_660990 [Cronartium quercuum f. sp. fusiforme G11]